MQSGLPACGAGCQDGERQLNHDASTINAAIQSLRQELHSNLNGVERAITWVFRAVAGMIEDSLPEDQARVSRVEYARMQSAQLVAEATDKLYKAAELIERAKT